MRDAAPLCSVTQKARIGEKADGCIEHKAVGALIRRGLRMVGDVGLEPTASCV